MAGETIITIVGNLTADPEMRYTQNGLAVASFTVASTPRTFNRQTNEFDDGEALFMRCSIWREYAEHVAGSLTKGTRVIVTGKLEQKTYQTKEGENRTSMELTVEEMGPSLRYATATLTREVKNANQERRGQQRQQQSQRQQGQSAAPQQRQQQQQPQQQAWQEGEVF